MNRLELGISYARVAPGPAVPVTPQLSDGLVLLRPWRSEDVPELVECCVDDEIARWLDSVPQPYTDADAAEYVGRSVQWWREGSFWSFAVTDAADGRLVGAMGLGWTDERTRVAEVGYWTRRDARGRGVAARALRLVAGWAFAEVGVQRLQLRAELGNDASQRVAQKAGFTREGVLRSSGWSERRGQRLDFVVYSLLPDELA